MIDAEQNDIETAHSFSIGLQVSNIEEDPFADDFKKYDKIKNFIFAFFSHSVNAPHEYTN